MFKDFIIYGGMSRYCFDEYEQDKKTIEYTFADQIAVTQRLSWILSVMESGL